MQQSEEEAADSAKGKLGARRGPRATGTGQASRTGLGLKAVRLRKQDAKQAAIMSRGKGGKGEERVGKGGKAARGDGAAEDRRKRGGEGSKELSKEATGGARASPKQGMIDPEKNTRVREWLLASRQGGVGAGGGQ
jgi:hypothetical protein